MLAHSSCIKMIVETDKSEEGSQMVDMLDSLEVNEKHLLIKMPTVMNTTLLTNKSINFNVYIFQEVLNRGNCGTWQKSLYKNNLYVCSLQTNKKAS